MKSGWTVVCLIAALLAGLGASAAVASPLLTAEEMSMVKGGCQLWCGTLDCAEGYPPNCNALYFMHCIPANPDYACNVTSVGPATVQRCLQGTDTGVACSQGSLTGCGRKWACACMSVDPMSGMGVCANRPVGYSRHYYPCEAP